MLETTGLADPAPLLFTLAGDPQLRHKFEPAWWSRPSTRCMRRAQSARFAEFGKQVALADRLVITKTDLAGADAARN